MYEHVAEQQNLHACSTQHLAADNKQGPSISNSVTFISLNLVPLFWLTSISSSPFFLLVSAHACSQTYVNAWRCGEAETLGYLDEVQFVNIKDRSQTVGRVCL